MSRSNQDDSSEFNELLDLYPSYQQASDNQQYYSQEATISQSLGVDQQSTKLATRKKSHVDFQKSQQSLPFKTLNNKPKQYNLLTSDGRTPQQRETVNNSTLINDNQSPTVNMTDDSINKFNNQTTDMFIKENNGERAQEKSVNINFMPTSVTGDIQFNKYDTKKININQEEIKEPITRQSEILPPIKGKIPEESAKEKLQAQIWSNLFGNKKGKNRIHEKMKNIMTEQMKKRRQIKAKSVTKEQSLEFNLSKEIEEKEDNIDTVQEKEKIEVDDDINKSFKDIMHLFNDLTISKSVDTQELDVINVIISSQSTYIIALLRPPGAYTKFQANIYSTQTLKLLKGFVLNNDSVFIKADKIKQDSKGETFCIPYNDNGNLHLFIFDEQEIIKDFDIMKNYPNLPKIEPLVGVLNPLATCNFIKAHCRKTCELQSYKLDGCKNKNFPYNSFYVHNDDYDETHIFYRQGGCMIIQNKDVEQYKYEQLADFTFGNMFLWRSTVLILRSSQQIILFKYGHDEVEDRTCWKQYHQFQSRGMISGSKKMPQFQLIEDKYIYFYEIDTETLMPRKVNLMENFLQCSMAIFGDKGKYCITFKENQKNFYLFKRKYVNDFKVHINTYNFEKSFGLAMDELNCFLVACQGNLYCFDSITYRLKYKIDDIGDLAGHEHGAMQQDDILYMALSKDSQLVAVTLGYADPTGVEFIEKIMILQVDTAEDDLLRTIETLVPEKLDFFKDQQSDISKKIYFDNTNRDCLIMANQDVIFQYNYVEKTLNTVFDFDNLDQQPEYFRFNDEQTVCIVSTLRNTLYIDLKTSNQIDLDEIFGISMVKFIRYYQEHFYILANKRARKLGFILLKLPAMNPIKNINDNVQKERMFLINEKNALDIDDVMMSVLEENDDAQLIISFKTIYINMYMIQVIDLKTGQLKYKHESFCMWETFVSGFLNSLTNDYVSFDQNGLGVMALSSAFQKKKLNAHDGTKLQVHSLASCQYLKLDPTNSIRFEFSQTDNQIIQIQDCFKDERGATCYSDIYKVRISTANIRQLLQIQSVMYCEGSEEVAALVEGQGSYEFFYQSFLELDRRNLVSILAFDSKAMRALLHDDRADHFDEQFPIFYRNLQPNGTINNAIDVAFKNNQIRGINLIIDHIIKHQNNYVSSFLFTDNLIRLMSYGIDLIGLLNSQVFYVKFEFPSWPGVHTNTECITRPFNGTIFTLRHSYNEVFPEIPPLEEDHESKISKIEYTVNLLPTVKEPENKDGLMKLVEDMNDEDTLGIFESEALINLIEYKWDTYAYFGHYVACWFHMMYIIFLSIYIYLTYLQTDDSIPPKCYYGLESDEQQTYVYLIISGFAFSVIYEVVQIFRTGINYFKDTWNYTDITFEVMGILNIYYQLTEHSNKIKCVASLTSVLVFALLKIFFFLRIFGSLAPLVSLMNTVIMDLWPFMFFYTLLMFKFGLILGVIGFQNRMRDFYEPDEDIMYDIKAGNPTEYPGVEYDPLDHFIGNMITIFRMSMGDNDLPAIVYLGYYRAILFWCVWLIICYFTFIIFFNFLIAEACKSYEVVTNNLDNILMQLKVALVNECEDIMPKSAKNKERFPKFLIIRDSIN